MEETCKVTSVTEVAAGVLSLTVEQPWRMKVTPGQVANVGAAQGKGVVLPLLQVPGKQEMEVLTAAFPGMKVGDALDICEVRDGMSYRGPGKFLVEGDGIGLGLSLTRHLRAEGKLPDHYFYYQAPTLASLVARQELRTMFGGHFTGALTDEQQEGYWHGRIEDSFLLNIPREINHQFYLCGSSSFIEEVSTYLSFYGAQEEKLQAISLSS